MTNSNVDSPNAKGKCLAPLDDYYECLHHKKEVRAPPFGLYLHSVYTYTAPTHFRRDGPNRSGGILWWPYPILVCVT